MFLMQCVAVCCNVLQCACCSISWGGIHDCMVNAEDKGEVIFVMQCVAVCCSVLQCQQCVAVCCSVLQCVAVCCSVLQCVAVCVAACCSVCVAVSPGVKPWIVLRMPRKRPRSYL